MFATAHSVVAAAALLASGLVAATASPARSDEWPFCGDDEVVAVADGATVVLEHRKSTYNCCPVRFDFEVEIGVGTIDIVETEVLEDDGCPCLCCYDHVVEIPDVAPGTWHVRWTYDERDVGHDVTLETDVVVPDVGQSGAVEVWTADPGECREPAVPAEEGVGPTTWSRTKARWR